MKRRHAPLLALTLAGAVLASPSFAQTGQPLSFVQPLSSQSIQAVQEKLHQAGAYNGKIDGMWGPDSATALQQFQQSHQLQVTGQMNQATAATLGLEPGTLLAETTPGQSVAAPPPLPPAPLPSDRLSASSIRSVQTRLRALNFYGGAVDGIWGQSTQTAIERFQQGRGLQANGQLNPATISALGLSPNALSYR